MIYSRLVAAIHEKTQETNFDAAGTLKLLQDSHAFVCRHPSETSKTLHNKLLDVYISRVQEPPREELDKAYRFAPGDLLGLERRFNDDPSNFSAVYELGIHYAQIGKRERGMQLLERVARSGYKEKNLALAALSNLSLREH
jgi:hypothetical protein